MKKTPRILPQNEKDWDPEIRQIFERIGYDSESDLYNILKTLARHPKMFKRWLPFANHVLFKSSLTPRIREIIILRTGWLAHSEYEWTQHIRIAREEAEMTCHDFEALEVGSEDPHWSSKESSVLLAVEELSIDKKISDGVWGELKQYFSQTELMDIVATVGNYTLVSMMLNSFGVELDDWLDKYASFPR